MKKFFLLNIVAVLALITAACGDTNTTTKTNNSNALTVYTTVYPLTYFTQRIGGENVQVKSIYPAGSNEHTFEPTQKDMMALADADLFFYIGLGLEGFVDNAKKTLANEDLTMIATADAVSDEEIAVSEVHEDDHAEEEGHEGHEDHDHGGIDPHLWISPQLSVHLAASIKDSLIEKDPDNKETYTKNYDVLVNDLKQLDLDYKEMANASNNKTFFVSHAAFGYLAGTYGLEQVAIAGLNSQDEPSQKELTELVKLAKSMKINTILFEQNISSNLTKVIQNEIGAEALTMHNLGVLTPQDIAQNEDYFTLMKQNLETLSKALNSSK
ncbi:metal ABC transporter solute-binding protein, Zn/Mn family [Paenisporosarcina sp. OV554]|uniref:metal ABC transporter solute-binding protein, Zn/Mn family n=1 Tax=Paenisporosarcina sp. OV554 TaxID=2135694 RepID=UPI000D36E38F|nr:zinc ABC transporter substrate-binding protein [Paenisporosarcina sp. OV554]PUB09858.1 zinc transport system substrate-binding protein [Paenisporosarcina sp. OV554]